MEENKELGSSSSEVNQIHTVPMEINAELKFKGTIPISMIIAALLVFFLAQRLDWLVYAPLKIAWYIYNVAVTVLMCIKTTKNGDKRIYQSILLYLTRDNNYYAPIENPIEYKEMEVSVKDDS